MSDGLEIRLLGPPEVFHGGQPIKFAARKALALFVYLVVEPGSHPREKLQAIFWPESEPRKAQSALRSTLARIKDAFRGMEDLLSIEGDRIGFNASSASFLDLNLVAAATADTQPTQLAPPSLALLQNAVEAARGPFLEAFSLPDTPVFNDWVIIQRNVFGGRLNLIHDRLSNYQLETHLIQLAIETVNRWLNLDRLNETAYQRLMRLQFLNGDRSAALQTYETCRELLDKELGVEPSSETEEVLAYIRSSEAPIPDFENQAEAREGAFHIPFVGRSNEYQALTQVFGKVRSGHLQVAVLSGESGMGKTRLADEFLKWAGIQGADVLRGRAYETSGGLPYQPIIDALRERLERENAPEDLLDDAWLMELTRILPELRERYPDLPSVSGDEATARSRLFEAIARLGASLSARNPLILLMDDLQWADAGTLELIHYLAHSWRVSHNRILLLILIREESLAHETGVRNWMSGLTRNIPVTRLSLPPVQDSDIRELIQSLTGENVEGVADLSAWLVAETNGQPFFVVETLSALDDYGALVWRDKETSKPVLDLLATLDNLKSIDSRSLAPNINDVVLSRLEWLSQPASAVLSAAAVIGRNCSFMRLQQVAGTNEQNSLDALDELLSARLVSEVPNETRPYNISHDRIREVVYAQISEARREVFHRRALTALTAVKAPSAELAHHALSAKEWGSAFQHSLNAGDEAMHLYQVATATGHYESARSLLMKSKADVDTVTCQHLYLQLGKAYELEFHHREAVKMYEEMEVQASALGNRKMELAALVALCKILPLPYTSQDLGKAATLALQAFPLAQTLEDVKAQAQIELSLARTHKFGDRQIKSTLQHLRAAEGWARKAGVRDELGVVLLELGVALMFLGQLAQARSILTESMEIFRELNQSPRVLSCFHNLAVIQLEMGKFDSALALIEEAYRENKALGSPTSIYSLAITQNVIHILRGQYGQALEALLPSLEIDKSQIVSGMWVDIYQQLAWCYYDLGAYDAGLDYCQRAVSHYDQTSQIGCSPAYTMLALLHVRRGNLTEAEAAVRKGWENFDLGWQTYAGWSETLSILEAEAELALSKGELDRAKLCAEQLLERYEELNLGHFKPSVLYLHARVELAAGNKENAHKTLCDALALSDEMGVHREAWEICWALGQLEIERGNELVAIQLKERARHEALQIANHAGAPELREAFLSQPDVQMVMSDQLSN
ncbi:MAG: AAA family ATPase [Anaerolineales bacterium]|nr:AAA family ATPase [Anaerolineales bacterium]